MKPCIVIPVYNSPFIYEVIEELLEIDAYQLIVVDDGSLEKVTFSHHAVEVHTHPSNLGKGELLYFVCPVSGKRCRTLFLAYGSETFKARAAYQNRIYYNSQWQSKYDYWLTRYWDYQEEVEAFREKPKKMHYQGKPTRIMKRLEEMEERLDYYYQRKEDIFNRRAANWRTYLF